MAVMKRLCQCLCKGILPGLMEGSCILVEFPSAAHAAGAVPERSSSGQLAALSFYVLWPLALSAPVAVAPLAGTNVHVPPCHGHWGCGKSCSCSALSPWLCVPRAGCQGCSGTEEGWVTCSTSAPSSPAAQGSSGRSLLSSASAATANTAFWGASLEKALLRSSNYSWLLCGHSSAL